MQGDCFVVLNGITSGDVHCTVALDAVAKSVVTWKVICWDAVAVYEESVFKSML